MSAIDNNSQRERYSRARLARDVRFDGVFFTAVKTTGIYCRSICPANPPKEHNVEYHHSAVSAAQAGYRPCLRCRPDSAPQSSAWAGTDTTFKRAISLINEGALHDQNITHLASRLGVSTRHLRGLFQSKLGTSPKKYALYQQCLFAKHLLHDSRLSVAETAFAAGFNSVRRFNEAMQERLQLTPSQIRKQKVGQRITGDALITLKLHYRSPYAWPQLLSFLRKRIIDGLEWCDEHCYGRTFTINAGGALPARGWFEVNFEHNQHHLALALHVDEPKVLHQIVQRIRLIFDLDSPIEQIDQRLKKELGGVLTYQDGLRIPGIWSGFEAGVRAILGQQVSVQQAHALVTTMVRELGEPIKTASEESPDKAGQLLRQEGRFYFPTPEAVLNHELAFLRMPQARKDTLRRLADHVLNHEGGDDYDAWLDIKGIGPWTVNYVKLRAAKDPDVWLDGDAGVKNALKTIGVIDVDATQPWRSYTVFHLWNQL